MSAIDFGVSERNEPYLILDYVSGASLAGLIKRTGGVPVIQALSTLIQIADGLAHAHKNGVIHRDIKPSNVILVEAETPSQTGEVGDDERTQELSAKIVDFGL